MDITDQYKFYMEPLDEYLWIKIAVGLPFLHSLFVLLNTGKVVMVHHIIYLACCASSIFMKQLG